MEAQQVKQRFGIIGNSPMLDRALSICIQVAPTDLSVLIMGESGTGKDVMPQITHALSSRKHNPYIAVNCGAIPEGTIDSELFGHEKGAFTGASDTRKGYFEVVDGGTIFLDEVAELPLPSQARLLRVLENGEFIRVGSSKVRKTDVRIICATNVNLTKAVRNGKFREDLYYRLNTVPVNIPALKERREDIHLLFRKFAASHAEKYRMPTVRLSPEAVQLLERYSWPGNIRQLKNVAEQISVIENEREIDATILMKYLPSDNVSNLPVLASQSDSDQAAMSEREILYKVLFDMKKDMNDLKTLVAELMRKPGTVEDDLSGENQAIVKRLYDAPTSTETPAVINNEPEPSYYTNVLPPATQNNFGSPDLIDVHEEVEESLSLEEREIELIRKALVKHNGKRKHAASELGISERTLYRKIKEHNIKG